VDEAELHVRLDRLVGLALLALADCGLLDLVLVLVGHLFRHGHVDPYSSRDGRRGCARWRADPNRAMGEIGLLHVDQDRVVGEGPGRAGLVERQEVRIAGRSTPFLSRSIHAPSCSDHDARHAALGDVGRHDHLAAVVPDLDRVAGLDAERRASLALIVTSC
jgi:hypothetical protein